MKKTEITVQIFESLGRIDKKLKKQGFYIIDTYCMKDWYYCSEENVKDLSYIELMNKSFLVRKVGDEALITYKSKEIDDNDNVLSEEKIEVPVKDCEKTIEIFKNVNLNNYCIVENESFVYKNKEICFAIQRIKGLGIFLEFEENEGMKHLDRKEKIEFMKKIVNRLGLKIGKDYSCKKVFMILNKDDKK